MSVRVRFAPSPTGNVHIGNIRVAIFNWLFARHENGHFLLRVEDTDRERSTPEAIETLFAALDWLGLKPDEEPVYQSRRRDAHAAAVGSLLEAGHAVAAGPGEPVVLRLHEGLFDPSFVTAPGEEATIDVSRGTLEADARGLRHVTTSAKSGETFVRPIAWDALPELRIVLAGGTEVPGGEVRQKVEGLCDDAPCEIALAELLGEAAVTLRFRRRHVYFEDRILGRLEKPLDSLRDMVIVRGDGSPVFHLANVLDDVAMGITHILRGNDHVENTYRHLFLFRALGATPPAYAHFPMIVNEKGKPYSKRDGDAFVGDFREKGYLPEALFNFLALCGWSPGGDREILPRETMVAAFSFERCNASASQFNTEKLGWMNGQYLTSMETEQLVPLVREELARRGIETGSIDPAWLTRLVEIEQERMRTLPEFVDNTSYFFAETVTLEEKAVKKVLLKKERQGLHTLAALRPVLAHVDPWSEEALEKAVTGYAEREGKKMGEVAQPLRVALTGGTVSPGIWETLFLVGRERSLERIDRCLETVEAMEG